MSEDLLGKLTETLAKKNWTNPDINFVYKCCDKEHGNVMGGQLERLELKLKCEMIKAVNNFNKKSSWLGWIMIGVAILQLILIIIQISS